MIQVEEETIEEVKIELIDEPAEERRTRHSENDKARSEEAFKKNTDGKEAESYKFESETARSKKSTF